MSINKKKIGVLFVCMGNICRSPAAEAIFKRLITKKKQENYFVASCGIGDWHIGSLPDQRMQEVAKERGIILSSRAQQFRLHFFEEYDYILVSDREVQKNLYAYAKKAEHQTKIKLMTEYSELYQGKEIPDPYYQPDQAFHLVIDMLEESCEKLLEVFGSPIA